jgi:hypothetical protein
MSKRAVIVLMSHRHTLIDHNYSISSYNMKLVKSFFKRDRLHWLKSVNENFMTQPQNLFRYVANFKSNNHTASQIRVGDNRRDTQLAGEVFADHFRSYFNVPFLPIFLEFIALCVPDLQTFLPFLAMMSSKEFDVLGQRSPSVWMTS